MRTLVIAALAASLTACVSPPITMDELQVMERGQDVTSIQKALNRKPYRHVDTTVDGTPYRIDLYRMQVGITYSTYMGSCGRGCFYSTSTPVPVAEPYAFVYKRDKLLTSGFIEELRKSEDPVVIALSEDISGK